MKEKNKFTIYAEQELFDRLKAAYLEDNCRSMNEFAVKAIEFYLGYLSGQQGLDTYTPILSSIIHNAVRDCEERISRNVFKLAVEQAKLSNLTAAFHDVDDSVMRGLHHKCVDEVSHINGILRFEDIYDYQHEKPKE